MSPHGRPHPLHGLFYLSCLHLLVLGCGSSTTSISKLSISPSAAAGDAIEQYDMNGDGVLSKDEIEACPGLAASVKNFDKDGNGEISRDEIEQRIDFWINSPTRMATIMCAVRMDGQPLPGATVTLVPEPFLAEAIKPASGQTGTMGNTGLAIAAEDLPEGLRGVKGVQLGLYRVEITHPDKQIPAKYNTETTLGCEIAPTTQVGPIQFNLSSR